VSSILVSSCGIWWGAAAAVLGSESVDQALTNYETTIGRTVDIAHYYHRGTQLFPTASEISRAHQAGAHRLLLENWKPENGSTWAAVAAGAQDAEIDAEAAHIKANFGDKFFLAIHHEPDDEVVATSGSGFTASDYAAMFRHVVLRLRGDGVSNIVTVMDFTGSPKWGSQSWYNAMYPGDDVVDWLAEDPYVVGPTGGSFDSDYDQMVNRTFSGYAFPGFYDWADQVGGNKPIMLAEWGVDDPASSPGYKAAKFNYMASHLGDMSRVKALVYWDSNTFPNVGTTRVDSSASSLAAFRALGSLPVLNPPVP
jgi:beta-mannanase